MKQKAEQFIQLYSEVIDRAKEIAEAIMPYLKEYRCNFERATADGSNIELVYAIYYSGCDDEYEYVTLSADDFEKPIDQLKNEHDERVDKKIQQELIRKQNEAKRIKDEQEQLQFQQYLELKQKFES